jgi:hypothetical protein
MSELRRSRGERTGPQTGGWRSCDLHPPAGRYDVTRGCLLTALFGLALITGATHATNAPAQTDAVRLRVVPTISAGRSVLVVADVSPARVLCSGTISRRSTAVKLRKKRALPRKKGARRGSVTWRAKIPRAAPEGTYTVRVSCGKAGHATARLRVTLPPAKVVVVKSGFAARRPCASCPYDISYGLVLQNASPDEDALGVYLTLKFMDANGRVVFARDTNLGPIPAAATYYYGEYLDATTNRTPTRLVASIVVYPSAKKSIGVLPPVTNIRVTDSSGAAHVLGEFTNPYPIAISFDAAVTVVCFDASGNVIGGGNRTLQDSVQPGGRGDFDVTIYALDASQIASARASVQPLFE